MQSRKLKIAVAFYVYGGNGGIATCNPYLLDWILKTKAWADKDERVEAIMFTRYCDTPIPMQRNRTVVEARLLGCDVVVMIDSDNVPDQYLTRWPNSKPFMESSFDFIYENWDKGPHMVAAPYCGPPPDECVYAFRWVSRESDHATVDFHLEMVSRSDAAKLHGIQEAAAVATGVCMWDIRCFELTEPKKKGDRAWFDYEYEDIWQSKKCSTEDVVASREISMAGCVKLGYNPVHVNWGAWAAHIKQKMVGPPILAQASDVSAEFRRALENKIEHAAIDGVEHNLRMSMVDNLDNEPWDPSKHPPLPPGMEDGPGQKSQFTWLTGIERKEYTRWGRKIIAYGDNGTVTDRTELHKIVKHVAPKLAIEIGSMYGESALAIWNGMCDLPDSRLYCVDHFQGTPSDISQTTVNSRGGPSHTEEIFKSNLAGLLGAGGITLLKEDSETAAARFVDETFDFIFLDAGHTYDECKADIERWLPKLRPGGTMAGHDYSIMFPGVVKAVTEMFPARAFHTDWSQIWHVRKPHPDDALRCSNEPQTTLANGRP